jgi:hypothetical protein
MIYISERGSRKSARPNHVGKKFSLSLLFAFGSVAIVLLLGCLISATADETASLKRKPKSWTIFLHVTLRKHRLKYLPGMGDKPRVYEWVDPVSRVEVKTAVRDSLQNFDYGFDRAPTLTVEPPPFDSRLVGHEDVLWTDIQEIDHKFLSRFKLKDIDEVVKDPGDQSTFYGLQIQARWLVDGAKEDMQMDSIHGVRPKYGTKDQPETKVHLELAAVMYERGKKSNWKEFHGEYNCKPILDQMARQTKDALKTAAGPG